MTARERQRGAVLVTVLWVVVVLMVIVTSMAAGTRRESRLAVNMLEAAQQKALARGAITVALQDLARPEGERRFQHDGLWYPLQLFDGGVAVAIIDARGLVDINEASAVILAGLFRVAGVSERAAAGLAENVIAWRQPGTGPPGGRRFHSTEEFQRVPGIDAGLYRQIAPVITVQSGGNRPDPQWAPPRALAAYPGLDLAGARDWMEERTYQRRRGGQLPAFPGNAPGSTGRPSIYLIRAVADNGQARGALTAVVRMTGRPDVPYHILEWRTAPPGSGQWPLSVEQGAGR